MSISGLYSGKSIKSAICVFILGICVFCCPQANSREAGWVPLTQSQPRQTNKKPANTMPKKSIPTKSRPGASASTMQGARQVGPDATVYDNQPLVTEREVNSFVELLPRFRAWARKHGEEAHPVVNGQGRPDFLFSPQAAQWVREHNFDPARFFCVMGRMAAGLVIVEEGNDFKGTRPPDMPEVSQGEIDLVRKHLGELLTAGGPAQPIK